jgi:hypothetical protein
VTIARDWREVYDLASIPENWPRWASGLGKAFENVGDEWIAEGPEGPIRIRFIARNSYGILDHWVTPAPGVEIYIPLRVIANQSGAEVMLTLFHLPGMTDDKFSADAEWVQRDLAALKQLMESQADQAHGAL